MIRPAERPRRRRARPEPAAASCPCRPGPNPARSTGSPRARPRPTSSPRSCRPSSFASTASPTKSSPGWPKAGRATPSGLAYTLKLRPNVAFSDGHPMTADDVVFSLEAAYAVPLAADSLQPGGKKLTMAAADPLTVVLTFPVPYAPGLRILDNLWVLPKHKLEAALKNGVDRLRVGPVHAAGGPRRPRPVRAERLQPRPADGVRAQPALLAEGREGHAAAVPRSADDRRRPRGEHPAAAPDVGRERRHDQRGAVGGVRHGQARSRSGEAPAVRPRRRVRRRRLLDQPQARRVRVRSPRGVAAARRAAPRDLDGRRSPAVRGHGVPRRRPAGVRPHHARQQEVVFAGRAADAARSRRGARAAGLDRPHRSRRRRHARGREPGARPLHPRHAEGPAAARARRVRHPRRAEEGRDRRGRRHARRERGDRADHVREVRSALLQRLHSAAPIRPATRTSGSAPGARTSGTSGRRRPPRSGRRGSTS